MGIVYIPSPCKHFVTDNERALETTRVYLSNRTKITQFLNHP
jgi:hypothetical protein